MPAYLQSYVGGKASLVAQTTASFITASLVGAVLATWASSSTDAGSGGNSNAPTNVAFANGYPDRNYATVKATATAAGSCTLKVTIPVAEIPTKGTRKLAIYYSTTSATATETLTATINHPGGTGDGVALPKGDYSLTPYTLTLDTVGTALSITFAHTGTAAATSTGSWLVDTAGVVVADYFNGQAADTASVCQSGRYLIMLRILYNSNALSYMGAGDGTTATSDSDTQLTGSNRSFAAFDQGGPGALQSPVNNYLSDTFSATFPPGTGIYPIREVTICAGASNSVPIFCRFLIAKPFTRTLNQSLTLTCTLTSS